MVNIIKMTIEILNGKYNYLIIYLFWGLYSKILNSRTKNQIYNYWDPKFSFDDFNKMGHLFKMDFLNVVFQRFSFS